MSMGCREGEGDRGSWAGGGGGTIGAMGANSEET